MSEETGITAQDEKWMRRALELAARAEQEDEVPVGAVVVVVLVVVGGVSLNAHSDQPILSWPYWSQIGFLPPEIVG